MSQCAREPLRSAVIYGLIIGNVGDYSSRVFGQRCSNKCKYYIYIQAGLEVPELIAVKYSQHQDKKI